MSKLSESTTKLELALAKAYQSFYDETLLGVKDVEIKTIAHRKKGERDSIFLTGMVITPEDCPHTYRLAELLDVSECPQHVKSVLTRFKLVIYRCTLCDEVCEVSLDEPEGEHP